MLSLGVSDLVEAGHVRYGRLMIWVRCYPIWVCPVAHCSVDLVPGFLGTGHALDLAAHVAFLSEDTADLDERLDERRVVAQPCLIEHLEQVLPTRLDDGAGGQTH